MFTFESYNLDLLWNIAKNVFAFIGAVAAFLAIIHFCVPDLRDRIIRLLTRTTTIRFRRSWDIDKINREIQKASDNITILQTWIPTLNHDIGMWEKASKNVSFHILLLNETLVSNRLKCRSQDYPLTDANIAQLSSLTRDQPKREVQMKTYDAIPFGPVYIIDDMVYWGIYISNRCSTLGPMFATPKGTFLGEVITKSVEVIWESGKSIELKAT